MRLTVAIPIYRPDPEHLRACLRSARLALPADAELVVVVDAGSGDPPLTLLDPEPDRVEISTGAPGLAGTWNACLRVAAGDFVHLLHQDDLVETGFYDAILRAFDTHPDASMCATAYRAIPGEDPHQPADFSSLATSHTPVELLEGAGAARFLLARERHCCGSVVLARERAVASGGFSSAYPYGPDEELYLRLAHGGLAFVDAPLYLQREHPGQLRVRTWLEPDFAASYVSSRRNGVRRYDRTTQRLALRTSARRVCSSMVDVAVSGHRWQATRQVVSLFRISPSLVFDWRVWATLFVVRVPGLLSLALFRRRRMVRTGSASDRSPSPSSRL